MSQSSTEFLSKVVLCYRSYEKLAKMLLRMTQHKRKSNSSIVRYETGRNSRLIPLLKGILDSKRALQNEYNCKVSWRNIITLGYYGLAKFVDFIYCCNGMRYSISISGGNGSLISFAVRTVYKL